jgi:hypothetical protein
MNTTDLVGRELGRDSMTTPAPHRRVGPPGSGRQPRAGGHREGHVGHRIGSQFVVPGSDWTGAIVVDGHRAIRGESVKKVGLRPIWKQRELSSGAWILRDDFQGGLGQAETMIAMPAAAQADIRTLRIRGGTSVKGWRYVSP